MKTNITLVQSPEGLKEVQMFLEQNKIFGLDIETNFSKYYFNRKVRTIQIGTEERQFIIDLLSFCNTEDLLYDSQGEYGVNLRGGLRLVRGILKPFFDSNEYRKVGSHLPFEYENLYWDLGLKLWNVYSVDLAERVLWAGTGGQASFKNYPFYSLASMVERHFNEKLDKTLQDSWTLNGKITPEQLEYAALDVIWPLKIREIQLPLLKKDGLTKTAKIEFDCIMPFCEMHLNGQRIDKDKWNKFIEDTKGRLIDVIKKLDEDFVDWCGSKTNFNITEDTLKIDHDEWMELNKVTPKELSLKKEIKTAKDLMHKDVLEKEFLALQTNRKNKKEELKKAYGNKKKALTAYHKLLPMCEGDALINYGSPAQVLKVLNENGFKSLDDTNDKSLKKFQHKPVIANLQKYREYSKLIEAYGNQWTNIWLTHPCAEEGWLWPSDGKLHPVFNQLDAETGRSTSEKPNGQNLPRLKELRSCFIIDPPDEEEPEGYVQVTVDMSGAELRIIAELSKDPVWISAFARGEDVHSVCTEIIYPELWKEGAEPGCAYFKDNKHLKCDCPKHKKLREETKAINFKIAYGGVAQTLADDLLITVEEAQEKLDKHRASFPAVWDYLEASGKASYLRHEARDMYGRRRIFNEPTMELAKKYVLADLGIEDGERPKFDQKEINKWLRRYYDKRRREPANEQLFYEFIIGNLIANKKISLISALQREGRNHCIQATNASIAKLAMGCGYDPQGKPYLWHILPQFKAKVIRFVHDELGVQCPKRFGEEVAQAIGDAFKRAAAEVMKLVIMEFDYKIALCWSK